MTLIESQNERKFIRLENLLPEAQFGMPQGTNTQGDIITQTVDGRDLNDIWAEFTAVLNFHNAERNALVSLLTFQVTEPIEDVPLVTTAEFERASEFGEPVGIRGGDTRQFGYDFEWYDIAIRYTWKFLADANAGQVTNLQNMALEADNRLVFNRVLKTIFDNRSTSTELRNTAIAVKPFYNGDGEVPPKYKNRTFDGTENHYLVSGGTVVDPGDLDDMETKLVQKGYGAQAGTNLVMLVNRAQVQTIRNFRVANGATYDFIPAQGQPAFFLPSNVGGIDGGRPASNYNGLTVVGSYGPWTIIEEDFIPSGYLVGFGTGGSLGATNPVGLREHANAGLRGLRLVKGRDNDYPLVDSFYNRGFGSGIRHRGAGVVMQVKASGSYAIPTEFQN